MKTFKQIMLSILLSLSFLAEANVNDWLTERSLESEDLKRSISKEQLQQWSTQSKQTALGYQSILENLRATTSQKEMKGGKPADGAILFISFSMPEEMILALAKEADSYDIPVVLKGLVNGDFTQTLERISALHEKSTSLGTKFSGFSIDPVWFEQFEITAVPTLVVTSRPAWCEYQKACLNQPFEKILGNVSITKGLQVIAERGKTVSQIARRILEDHHV